MPLLPNPGIDPHKRALYDSFLAERAQRDSAGIAAAEAERQSRMGQFGGLGGNDMAVLMRRDPRAATALLASQFNAQANAEQGQLDRESRRELLMGELFARMNENAAQRAFQGQRDDRQFAFQGSQADAARKSRFDELSAEILSRKSEGQLARDHAIAMQGKLLEGQRRNAQMQIDAQRQMAGEEFDRNAPYRETPAQRSQRELMLANAAAQSAVKQAEAESLAKAKSTLPAEDYETVASRFLASSAAPGSAAPALKAKWLKKAGEGKDKLALKEFLHALPTTDISNNRDAIDAFLAEHYPRESIDDALTIPLLFGSESNTNALRKAFGLNEQGGMNRAIRAAKLNPITGGSAQFIDWLMR